MRLVVAGNARRYLAPFAGGTAYVVEGGGARLVVDCGLGTLAAIGATLRGASPDALVLSHFHFDHVGDYPEVAKAMRPDAPVFVPPGGAAALADLGRAYHFRGGIEGPRVVEAPREAAVGAARLAFAPTRHRAPGLATAIEADGRRLVLASDGAATPELAALARGADLLVVHALLPDVEAASEHARVHMTARAAGRLAKEAGARRLLLSHVFHGADPEAARAAAAESFAAVEVAESGRAYEV